MAGNKKAVRESQGNVKENPNQYKNVRKLRKSIGKRSLAEKK